MSTQLQLRRGTTAQHSTFTGASGEITIDTDKKTVVVHDGTTAGGMPVLPKTITDGTANGVLYLNGSKVATSGSELTFDGTNLGTGGITLNDGTANGVAYLNDSKVLTSGSALTFDGTNLETGGIILSDGTANGVAYLNGSKVLTSGSALTFDGTNLRTGGITFADASTQSTGGYTGFRNRIINGAMMIDQRNAGASVTPAGGAYLLDRWVAGLSQSSKYSVQQNAGAVTPPVGFVNYLGVTSLSAYSVGTSDFFAISQRIEGLNVSDLGWGTANAATVTLSFWVRSSLTGTFGGSVANNGSDRSYPFSYTINSANTWEQKSITIAGDTSGTWLTTNGRGMVVNISLGMGSTYSGTAGTWAATNYLSATGATSVVGTNGATFYITGVQLEKGSVATPFEFRPYGQELALCQRYFQKIVSANGYFRYVAASGAQRIYETELPVIMRSSATATIPSYTTAGVANSASVAADNHALAVNINATGAGVAGLLTNIVIELSAEL